MTVSVMQILIYTILFVIVGAVIGAGIALLMFAHSYMREEEKRLRNEDEIR